MQIYRDENEWVENCQICQVPMYRVIVSKGKVLTGFPVSVHLEPDSKMQDQFKLWEQHPCVLPNTVHWCPKCRELWAVAVGLPIWTKAGVIEDVNKDLHRMLVRKKFDLQNDMIPVPVSGQVQVSPDPDPAPFEGATKCIQCRVWREQRLQAVQDQILVWHWCAKCGQGEPMPEIKISPEQVTLSKEEVKEIFPPHVASEDILT